MKYARGAQTADADVADSKPLFSPLRRGNALPYGHVISPVHSAVRLGPVVYIYRTPSSSPNQRFDARLPSLFTLPQYTSREIVARKSVPVTTHFVYYKQFLNIKNMHFKIQ